MSKSLNQAFIKAYSKEKASQLAQPSATSSSASSSAAPKAYGNDDFIVRFDTATCSSIPDLHLEVTDKSQGSVNSAASAVRPAVREQAAQNPLAPQSPSERKGQQFANDALRNAIAEQMSRAGDWQGSSIDAFLGGIPMLSTYHHQRVAPPHFRDGQTRRAVLMNNRNSAQALQAVGTHAKSVAVKSVVVNSTNANSINANSRSSDSPLSSLGNTRVPDDQTPVVGRVAPLDSSATSARVVADAARPVAAAQSPSSQSPSSQGPSSPGARPLGSSSSSSSLGRELDAPKLQSPVQLAQQSSGQGEFFRLDRPSYAPAPAPLVDGPFSDSGELSSEILGLSASHINLEPPSRSRLEQTLPLPERALPADKSPSSRVEQAQSVERELRRSKLRIFNPVWEVDSFQWPDICLELLAQRADSLEVVARNLSDAVQEGLQVLAVTSPQGGEGRTTVACCLAKLAGSRGLNVAIVDGDIENPTLSYQTNLDVEQDWKTAILNQLPLEEIAVHSIDDQVTLVPLIGPIDQSEMSADDNRIEFMLHELSESFDLVIVDMGHMSSPRSLVNSLGARGVISAVVAVVDHRTGDARQVENCLRRIRQTGVASIGVVENFAA